MSDSGEEHVGESSSSKIGSKRTRQCNRHTVEQIQQLEAFFKECPHPDECQRNQLSREAGLDSKQIKFWFQNKRTQMKSLNERSDNSVLRAENERFLCENKAMKEALKNVVCPKCDGPPIGIEERKRNIERLRKENQMLKEMHGKVADLIAYSLRGYANLAQSNSSTLDGLSFTLEESLLSQTICGSPVEYPPPPPPLSPYQDSNNVRGHYTNINNIPIMSPISPQDQNYDLHVGDRDLPMVIEIAIASMEEMIGILQVNDSIWEKSSSDGRCFIQRDRYEKMIPNPNRPYNSPTARYESSKDCGVVSMTAIELIQMFIDPVKWMNMFPSIVAKAKTLQVIDTGNMGGSIQMMHEKLHILSPLVEAREIYFIRYCRRLDEITWIMMDVSYNFFKEIQSGAPTYTWKFPSGCVIQDMGNGQSMVTWFEHVQVEEKHVVHDIYRDLLCDRQTFGAKRWIVTLQRMCERYNFSMGATFPTRNDHTGVIDNPEGLKNVMHISQQMVKTFFEILGMTEKLDLPTPSQLNNVDKVSIRKNAEITQPKGFIVTAATSLCIPLPCQTIFNYFKDDDMRRQWDILTKNNVTEFARIPTGPIQGNCITIFQPYMTGNDSNMILLQESNIDEMGAYIIYAPTDLSTINSIINGCDFKKVLTLPSGIIITPNGCLESDRDNLGNSQNGSIVTLTFQKLVCGNKKPFSQQQQIEAMTSVYGLMRSSVSKIKVALGCSSSSD